MARFRRDMNRCLRFKTVFILNFYNAVTYFNARHITLDRYGADEVRLILIGIVGAVHTGFEVFHICIDIEFCRLADFDILVISKQFSRCLGDFKVHDAGRTLVGANRYSRIAGLQGDDIIVLVNTGNLRVRN